MSAKPFRIQGAQTLSSAPVAQVNRSTAVVDQLQGAAADIRREGEKLEAHRLKRTEEKERFGSLVGLQKFKAELAVENQRRLDGMEKGAEGYAAEGMEFYETAEEKYLATVPQSQQQNIQLRLGDMRAQYLNGVSSTERDENIRYQFETVKGTLNSYELELRTNPGSFSEVKEQAFALIDATSIPLKNRARLKGAALKQYGLSWAGGLSARQKVAWFKSGGEVPAQFSENVSGLDAGDFAKIERAGETELRVAAAELRPQIKDHFASLEATGVGLPGMDGKAESVLSGEDLAGYREGVQDATGSFEAFEAIKAATPVEIVEILQSNKAVPGVEGFANNQRRSVNLQRAAQKVMTAREQDPAGYVSSFDEVKDLQEAGASQAEIVKARFAAQTAIGVPRSLQSALSKGQATGIVNDIMSTPPADRAARLEGLEVEFGDVYESAFGDLVKAGLDPQTRVLATITDDPATAQMLANGIDIGEKELKVGLEKDEVNDLSEALQEAVEPFRQAFEAGDYTGQASSVVNDLQRAARLVALQHMRGGMSASEAADTAFKSFIDNRYDVYDTGRYHAYVPRVGGEAVVPQDKLETASGLAQARDALVKFNPRPFSTGVEGGEAMDLERTLRTAENSGYWVTNSTATGLVLLVPFAGGGALPLENEQGEQYELLFDDVKNAEGLTRVRNENWTGGAL